MAAHTQTHTHAYRDRECTHTETEAHREAAQVGTRPSCERDGKANTHATCSLALLHAKDMRRQQMVVLLVVGG